MVLTLCVYGSIMYGGLLQVAAPDGKEGSGATTMRIEIEQFSATMQMLKGLVFICDKNGSKLLDRQLRVRCRLSNVCLIANVRLGVGNRRLDG